MHDEEQQQTFEKKRDWEDEEKTTIKVISSQGPGEGVGIIRITPTRVEAQRGKRRLSRTPRKEVHLALKGQKGRPVNLLGRRVMEPKGAGIENEREKMGARSLPANKEEKDNPFF